MDQYSAKSKSYSQELGKINKIQHNQFAWLCVSFFFLGSLYYYIQDSGIVLISAALFFIGFLMRIHSKLLFEKD
jgi:hypothetical protein